MTVRRRALVGVVAMVVIALLAIGALEWRPADASPPAPAPKVARTHRAPDLRPRAGPATLHRVEQVPPTVEAPPPPVEAPPPPPPEEEVTAAVYGRVHGAEKLPEGAVSLEGCGVMPFDGTPIDASGEFFAQVQAGRCQMRAWRTQGALRIPGPWVELDTENGADANVDLSVPDFEPAGMGITFRATDEGVFVLDARPGTPAAEAGLQHGDQILLIDGESTADMDQDDFLTHGIGPSGTKVHVEGVSADGQPFDVTMTRRPIRVD